MGSFCQIDSARRVSFRCVVGVTRCSSVICDRGAQMAEWLRFREHFCLLRVSSTRLPRRAQYAPLPLLPALRAARCWRAAQEWESLPFAQKRRRFSYFSIFGAARHTLSKNCRLRRRRPDNAPLQFPREPHRHRVPPHLDGIRMVASYRPTRLNVELGCAGRAQGFG